MPKIDADFLRNVQKHCNGGREWCEKRDIRWLDLIKHTSMTASAAAEEDAGLASYGVAMFKLGYEVRRAQGNNGKEETPQEMHDRLGRGETLAEAREKRL